MNEAIRQCGLEDVLNLWVSSSVTGRLKPEPDVYLRAMQELDDETRLLYCSRGFRLRIDSC